jgi:hypothetical protein
MAHAALAGCRHVASQNERKAALFIGGDALFPCLWTYWWRQTSLPTAVWTTAGLVAYYRLCFLSLASGKAQVAGRTPLARVTRLGTILARA